MQPDACQGCARLQSLSNEEATRLRAKGESVVHLGIGEPKNKMPINAIITAAAKLNSGDVKYTPTDGIPSLKQAIIRYTEENYDKVVGADNVIVTSGARQAIFNALYAILNPQDEVIIPVPYWVSYPEMVKMVYGVSVFVAPEDGGVYPRMRDIEEAVTSYTRAMIINSPNNPSGVIYPEEFVADVVDFCEEKNIWLIMDDIYHRLVFDGKTVPSCFRYTNRDIESTRVIVINGVSKSYDMTGFRIGWAVATSKLVEIMNNVQARVTSGASVALRAAAEGALTGLQGLVESLRLTIRNNRDQDPVFRFTVPTTCDGVPASVLNPADAWPNKRVYLEKYRQLAAGFIQSFKKFRSGCALGIIAAGPVPH